VVLASNRGWWQCFKDVGGPRAERNHKAQSIDLKKSKFRKKKIEKFRILNFDFFENQSFAVYRSSSSFSLLFAQSIINYTQTYQSAGGGSRTIAAVILRSEHHS